MDIAADNIVHAEALARRFGKTIAVDGINLTVRRGEIVGLVGPDGAGKTTLLQLLAGILDPSSGQCRTLGFDTVRDAQEIAARIGYMAQGFTLYESLTVEENMAFSAGIRSIPKQQYQALREQLLAMARLEPFLSRREGALSGGMRKKLALCANLVHEPELLLLDEPGLGVDPLSRRELWRMLAAFRDRGATIMVTTSYMDEAERCDRVLFLDQGRLLTSGTPHDLRATLGGRVFQIQSAELVGAEARLRAMAAVAAIQWRGKELRLIRVANSDPAELVPPGGADERAWSATPVAPTLEDVFASLLVQTEPEPVRRKETGVRAPKRPGPPEPSSTWAGPVDPAIDVREISVSFGDFVAVDNVSLAIRPGEIFGLLGANGAGKTTLIRVLCGLHGPSAGTGRVGGFDIARQHRQVRQHIGYMSQSFSLYGDLSAGENLAFFASAFGLRAAGARQAIGWARRVTALEDIDDNAVADLSGAVRQRLALACAIMHRPRVLFLDEPTSGVDPLARARFWRLINGLAEEGTAIVVTTHYLEEASYCHRLGLMHRGQLIAKGTPAELTAGLPSPAPEGIEDIFLAYITRAQAAEPAEEVSSA